MAEGNNNMNHNQAELKELAKTLGRSLKRSGHEVPHTALLNALASGLNLRDWNTLKAVAAQETPTKPSAVKAANYSEGTLFLARLALLKGLALPPEAVDEQLKERLLEALDDGQLSGVLKWGGWNLPADLDLRTCKLDAGDFKADAENVRGSFALRLGQQQLSWEVGYRSEKGWFLTAAGASEAKDSVKNLLPEVTFQKALPGRPVLARLVSDDQVAEVVFDIRPWLMRCNATEVACLLQEQFNCEAQPDAVAEWMGSAGGDPGVKEVFDYLAGAQQFVDDLGYSVYIDAQASLTWLSQHAPAVLNKALCRWQDVDLVQAEEEEIRGRWDWIAGKEACDMSFETEEEAAADAVRQLGFLATAVEEMPRFDISE